MGGRCQGQRRKWCDEEAEIGVKHLEDAGRGHRTRKTAYRQASHEKLKQAKNWIVSLEPLEGNCLADSFTV